MLERFARWFFAWDTELLIARHLAYQQGYERGVHSGRFLEREQQRRRETERMLAKLRAQEKP